MDNERRKQLGYTLERLQALQRITGTAPGEDLPPFPAGEDFTARRSIYQEIDLALVNKNGINQKKGDK